MAGVGWRQPWWKRGWDGLVEVEDNGRGLDHHQGEPHRSCESCRMLLRGPRQYELMGKAEYSCVRQSYGFGYKLSS